MVLPDATAGRTGTLQVRDVSISHDDAGKTNASVKAEGNGLFIVQRPDDAATLFAMAS